MRGNTFGRFLTVTSFGESHGAALGAVIDGCPAGIAIGPEDFERALARRRPGQSAISTSRAESDRPEILSGIFEGKTLGTPIAVLVRNEDARSSDYDPASVRPGHADEVWEKKFGLRDWRGGGRSSGRETLARVIGGVAAVKILPPEVKIVGFARSVGGHLAVTVPEALTSELVDRHPTRCPDPSVAAAIEKELLACKESGDSRGGVAEIWADGVPAGWGEPVFRKLKSELAAGLMSVGGVVGVEIGAGCTAAARSGLNFHASKEGAGGIQGGLSNGERILLRAAFKPAATLGMKATKGRHDPCIVPRAIPVLEAMTALVLADFYLESRLNRAS
jgi:chorismate synthase